MCVRQQSNLYLSCPAKQKINPVSLSALRLSKGSRLLKRAAPVAAPPAAMAGLEDLEDSD